MNHIPSGDDKISKPARVAFNFLQKKLTISKNYTFLDVGCGKGRDINFLSSKLDNIIFRGIDISFDVIENAIELNSHKDNVTFECMDWKDLDDTQYDIIYTSGVYHFFPLVERRAFISKLRNILNPRGFFFMTTLSSKDTQYYGKGEPVKNDPNSFQSEYFLHFCSEDELRENFGFLEIVDLYEYFHKNYSTDKEYHTMWLLIGKMHFLFNIRYLFIIC